MEREERHITILPIMKSRAFESSRLESAIINMDWRRGPRGHPEDDSSSSHGACIRASHVRSSSIYAEQFNDNGALRGERRSGGFKDLRGREPATPRSRPPPLLSQTSSSSSFFLLRRARDESSSFGWQLAYD